MTRRRSAAVPPSRRARYNPGGWQFRRTSSLFRSRLVARIPYEGGDAVVARVARLLLASVLTAVGAASVPHSAAAPPGLRLAVLPCSNIETTFKKFHPLLSYLKDETGLVVSITIPVDLAEFESQLKNGSIDLALQDPHTYGQVARYLDGSALLQTRALNGTTEQSGVVIVRRDSGVRSLADLRGKAVMFGKRASTPKWVAARQLFESEGVSVDRELQVVNGGCCEDIAFSVFVKSVDAGVICDHFLSQHAVRQKELGVEPESLLILGRTPGFPTRIFAARQSVAPASVRAVIEALLRLDAKTAAHAAILASAELGGFVRTTERAYLAEVARSETQGRK
jgi:phosphonate transport system substrate-binding protein